VSNRHCTKNQLAITKVLIMPDVKPDIERILRVTSTPKIHKYSTIPETVALTGKVNTVVEYVACSHNNSQPIHFSEFEIPFAHFIDHPCIKKCQNVNMCISVEFQEVQVLNRRSITIFLILKTVLVKIGPSKLVGESHICAAEHIMNVSSEAKCMCSQLDCVEDGSASQPCSFGTCVIECE